MKNTCGGTGFEMKVVLDPLGLQVVFRCIKYAIFGKGI